VVLSFDPDAAGQGAATRSCEMLVGEGFDVNVLTLDKGEDPDAFIRKKGGPQYRERLRASKPYLEYLLDQASVGVDFERDEQRRQFLSRMLAVASQIPEAAARDQFADRIAHKARVTEDVVRQEIRKAAVQKRTEMTPRELPSLGQLKDAEKGLIWCLIHNTAAALGFMADMEPEDMAGLASREVLEVAQSLKDMAPERLPSMLLQRLSSGNAQIVTSIAATPIPYAAPEDCVRALRRLRLERDRAAIQREINRLQELGPEHGNEIDALLRKKNDLGLRIEDLT
jgi:DNA primase